MLHLHRNSKFNKTMEHNLIAVSTILVEQYKEDFEFAIMFENITNKLFVYQTILCDYTELKENEDVSDLTNGFETPHTVAYKKTTNDEIMWAWGKFVDEHYTGNNKSELYDFYFDFDDNSNIINSKQIVSDWLEEFAADMRVKIENVTVSFGRKFLYVTGYNY